MQRLQPARRRVLRSPLALVPAVVAALALPASTPASPAPQGGGRGGPALETAPGPQQEEIQRFDATVSRVRVDVIVTDGDGNFVPDLSAADFVVYEDGVPQEIVDLQLVDLAAGEVHPLMGDAATVAVRSGDEAAARRDPAAAARGAAAADVRKDVAGAEADDAGDAPTSAASELGALIFLIDGPSLSVQARARFGDAWNQMLEQTEGLKVPRAAYMVDNVGRLQELASLGYDLEAMRSAAQTVREAPFFGDRTRRRLVELANDLSDPFIPPEDARSLAAAKARSYEGQERGRSLASYELLTSFADALWTRSGRTAVVWVSSGIKLMQGGPYSMLLDNTRAAFSPDPAIYAAQEALHRAANGSNVSIYTVDPTLLTGSRMMGADVEVGRAGMSELLGTPEMMQSLDGLRDALRTAAAETGGRSFIHATDLGMVLEEIEADTSRFYLLTYAPPNADGDGDYHAIRVEVAREGVDVRARGGYVDHAPADRARRLIAAALALPGSVTDLPVEAEVFLSRRGPGAPNALLAVAVEGSEVGVMMTPEGERRVSIDIHALALRGHQPVSESHEQFTARSSAGDDVGADPDEPSTAALAGYFAYQREWTLAPGTYTFNVAAFDNVTGRVGATSLEVEIPPSEDAWGLSDPLLVTVNEAGRVQPVVMGHVLEGQNLAAFVEVYGGVQPILSGQVFLEGGEENQQRGARLFPIALRRVASGLHRGSAPLPPGMPPGRYVVQLVITDPPAQQHRIVRRPIEVVAPRRR